MLKPGIQTKLIVVLFIPVFSILAILFFVVFSLNRINDNFQTLNQTSQRTRIIGQALLSLQDSSSSLGFSLGSDSSDLVAVRNYEAQFNNSSEDLKMFISAMLLGSESSEFKSMNNGSLYDLWVSRHFSDNFSLSEPNGDTHSTLDSINNDLQRFISVSKESFGLKKKNLTDLSEGKIVEKSDLDKLSSLNDQIQKNKETLSNSVNSLVENNNNLTNQANLEYSKAVSSLYFTVFFVSVLSIILMLSSGYYASYVLVSRPIKSLTEVATAISIGKLDAKIDPKVMESKDEIGTLAKAFDRTMVSLKLAMKFNGEKQQVPETPKASESSGDIM